VRQAILNPRQHITPAQTNVADALRIVRPTVVAGTRVVQDNNLRGAWYLLCTFWAGKYNLDQQQAKEFFDRAGVPD